MLTLVGAFGVPAQPVTAAWAGPWHEGGGIGPAGAVPNGLGITGAGMGSLTLAPRGAASPVLAAPPMPWPSTPRATSSSPGAAEDRAHGRFTPNSGVPDVDPVARTAA